MCLDLNLYKKGKMRMDKMDEQILVIDREYLFDDEELTFQGVMTDPHFVKEIERRFKNYFEVRRGDAEDNPNWKQPIPYVIIKRGESVFVYKRLKAGGEERLHEQLSIGVGGHMNIIEGVFTWDYTLMGNLYRELDEELNIQSSVTPVTKIIGLINDDENEVGKVHIGILAVMELPEEAEVTVKETDQLEGYWIRIRDLNKTPLFESLESWSQIAAGIL